MKPITLLEETKLKIINWLEIMKIPCSNTRYRYSKNSGDTLFTSCFALFILDLFKETENFSNKDRCEWADYINSFQKEDGGLFFPKKIYHTDKERSTFQLTCFALSALLILGFRPRYRLSVVNNWNSSLDVTNYLYENGCHKGLGGSGNKAMFQAIFLTHEYERTGNQKYIELLNTWFNFHESYKNDIGFFGKKLNSFWYKGLQNALHQLIIYNYWGRYYSGLEHVANVIPFLQDTEGYFAPNVGGGACEDYDAVHFMITCLHNGINIKGSDKILNNAVSAIKMNQNKDGGFCESYLPEYHLLKKKHKQILHFISSPNKQIFKLRLKEFIKSLIKDREIKHTSWVNEGQLWSESTLWATWFRCLLLADIAVYQDAVEAHKIIRHHRSIGLGISPVKNSPYQSFKKSDVIFT